MAKSVIDHCIDWNRKKAKNAKTEADRARYEDNIRNLEEYKNG